MKLDQDMTEGFGILEGLETDGFKRGPIKIGYISMTLTFYLQFLNSKLPKNRADRVTRTLQNLQDSHNSENKKPGH